MSASTRMSSKNGEVADNERDSFSSTFTDGFGIEKNMVIPQLPMDKWVLDFGKSEIDILKEITNIIQNETSELEQEIKVQQDLIMNKGKIREEPKPALIEEPSPKELFEFKSRLEVIKYF